MTSRVNLNVGIKLNDLGSRLPKSVKSLTSDSRTRHSADPDTELATILYNFVSDIPDDVMVAVVEAVMSLLLDQDLSDQDRLIKVEEIIDTKLSSSDMDKLSAVARRKLALTLDNEENLSDDSDYMSDSESTDVYDNSSSEPHFVALNDPIRIKPNTIVSPKEIDSQWLELKLSKSKVSVEDILSRYVQLRELSPHHLQMELEQLLGPENLALSQLLSRNLDVIVLYTKLALALSDEEKLAINDEITKLGLATDQSHEDIMNEDLPRMIDLSSVGKPLNEQVNVDVSLPPNSTKFMTSLYEQFNVPAEPSSVGRDTNFVKINELPKFLHNCFGDTKTLNTIQSKVANSAIYTDVNILVSAPTGAGKTNIAVMSIAKCLNDKMRVVYISPQKALVQEQVATFTKKFSDFKTAELSGDSSLGRWQLTEIDIIVSTPEKWDVVSRKKSNIEFIRSVGLVIIDEIHLLHDEERGGIIENLVIRHKDIGSRLIGLSATLPNYTEVATFMNVPASGLFYFDASFRPVPLQQQYVGVLAQSPLKKRDSLNSACIEKVREIAVDRNKQLLVFVHSRKDTELTRNLLLDRNGVNLDADAIGIHHAGLSKEQRSLSESLFREGKIRVLICTATLAWGVNLPAAAVIIKGTDVYNPSSKGWQQLSPQDVLQMLGRAGRPGFDSEGLGIILTSRDYLGYFASIARLSVPIESHLVHRITDSLNAEIVLNNVTTIEEACQWLQKSFWAVRWKSDPAIYGDDYRLVDLAHTVLTSLKRSGAVSYKYPNVQPTKLGELAANFYITPESIELYARRLRPWNVEPDVISVFALSGEFQSLAVRPGEEGEIQRLRELVPIPVKGESNTIFAKVSVLLQSYVGRLSLTGLALQNDAVYIAQSATRLFRAIFELAIELRWGRLAEIVHRMYTMVDHRLWAVGQSSFRQFPGCPEVLARNAEATQLHWSQFFHLRESDLASVLKLKDDDVLDFAKTCLEIFPRFRLDGNVKPLTSTWFVIDLQIDVMFEYENLPEEIYETFYLLVENQSEDILFSRRLSLSNIVSHAPKPYSFHICVENSGSRPPYVFIKILSDRWLNSVSETVVNLRNIGFPQESPNMYELETDVTGNAENSDLMENNDQHYTVSPLIRALKPLICDTERSVYIGLPPGPDQENLADLVIGNAEILQQKVLLLHPHDTSVDISRFEGRKACVLDARTAELKTRSASRLEAEFSDIDCLICCDLQSVGGTEGHLYEMAATRLKIFWSSKDIPVRIIGLGYQLNSVQSMGSWLGVRKSDAVNFENDVREPPMPAVEVQQYDGSVVSTLRSSAVTSILSESDRILIVVSSQRELAKTERELYLISERKQLVSTSSITVLQLDAVIGHNVAPDYESVIVLHAEDLEPNYLKAVVCSAKKNALVFSAEPEYSAMLISKSIPAESCLNQFFADALIPEILNERVVDPQSAIKYISSTFLYRRVLANPGYYGCRNKQDWVSELVQSSFENLASMGVIEIVDEDSLMVKPLELCYIMTHAGASISDLASILPKEESSILPGLTKYDVESLSEIDSRITLCVAINRPLSVLFELIDKRQSLARSLPMFASSLLQIPWIDSEIVLRCNDAGISSILDFIRIEDDELRSTLLGFDNKDSRMVDVANFINAFPIVDIVEADVRFEVNNDATVTVSIESDIDEDIATDDVNNARETWFVVIGDTLSDTIMGFKRIAIVQNITPVEIKSTGPLDNAKIWLLSGNFVDADKEHKLLSN